MIDPLEGMTYEDRYEIGADLAVEFEQMGGREVNPNEYSVLAEHAASWLWDSGFVIVKRGIGDNEGTP